MPTVDDMRIIIDAETARMVAKLDAADRRMAAFERGTSDRLKRFDSYWLAATRGMTAFVGAMGINAGLDGLTSGIKSAIEGLGQIKDAAESAGIASDMFQGLEFAALQAGTSTGDLGKALDQFAKSVGDAKNAQGSLYSTLRETDPAFLRQIVATRDQETALRLMADQLAKTEDATKRTALASQAFGSAGKNIGEVLSDGSKSIDQMTAKAKEMGWTIDDHIIKRASEMDTQLKVVTAQMDRQFKMALIELGPIAIDTARAIGVIAEALNRVLDNFRSLENVSVSGLGRKMQELAAIRDQKAMALGPLIADLEAADNAGLRVRSNMLRPRVEALRTELNKINDDLIQVQRRYEELTTPKGAEKPKPTGPNRAFVEETKAAGQHIADLHRQALEARQRSTEAVLIEYNKELQHLIDLKRKTLITEEQYEFARTQLVTISRRRLMQAVEQDWSKLRTITDSISSNMERAFDQFAQTGKLSMADFTRSVLNDLAKIAFRMMVIQPLFGGQGQGFGLFGQMFGLPMGPQGGGFGGGSVTLPAFANGGRPDVGMPSIVGERGPEMFVPRVPGTVIPNHMLPKSAGAIGGEIVVTVVASPELVASIETTAQGVVARSAPAIVGASVSETRKSLPSMIGNAQRRQM